MRDGQRLEGIDYLRAIFSVFVVVWHMVGVPRSSIFSEEGYRSHVFSWSDFFNFHILLVSVPCFIFISVFLFSRKENTLAQLLKQLKRIFLLLIFWVFGFLVFREVYLDVATSIPESFLEFLVIFFQGGGTIYYFFTSLLLCIIVSYFYAKLELGLQLTIFFMSICVLASLPFSAKATGLYHLSAYWNPLNFIPVALVAVLMSNGQAVVSRHRSKIFIFSLSLAVAFSFYEWVHLVDEIHFPGQGYFIPAYSRVSLLFSVISIMVLAIHSGIRSTSLIDLMSKFSLALYCLHPFLMDPVRRLTAGFGVEGFPHVYASILLVIIFSYFIAFLLERYFLKKNLIF